MRLKAHNLYSEPLSILTMKLKTDYYPLILKWRHLLLSQSYSSNRKPFDLDYFFLQKSSLFHKIQIKAIYY